VGSVPWELDPDVAAHYGQGVERDRLTTWGLLEAVRTREMLDRFLPPPPAVLLDVGGAEGAYALPLARSGYAVHLVDPLPAHVAVARDAATLASAEVGDARELAADDATIDAVLLLGPLYHLVERRERARALAEALRVLRPGGRLLAAAISRFASSYDALRLGAYADPVFERIVEGDLRDGIHRNPRVADRPEWFTLSYFHTGDELRAEVLDAGFVDVEVLAVEGIGAGFDLHDALHDPGAREAVLRTIRRLEREPSLMGASPHLMAIGTKSPIA
jgi:ubiquinone/menaquinone biosynthesis C-methylase UbiE